MADVAIVGPLDPPDLQVMTFNIRRRFGKLNRLSPDRWARRRGAVARLLTTERPVVIGFQECLPEQTRFVAEALGASYEHVGHGRNADHRGEQCPLFFDTQRLQLDDWRQIALSDTPGVAGSRTWGNRTPRMAVIAIFTDRSTGRRFRVINTHLDNASRMARLKSAHLLTGLLDEVPTVITGDFNTSVETGPYRQLTIGGRLRDTWFAAGKRLTDNWGSFPDYRQPRLERKRIDWILVSPGIEVRSAAINPSRYDGVAPSDHLAVQAVVRISR